MPKPRIRSVLEAAIKAAADTGHEIKTMTVHLTGMVQVSFAKGNGSAKEPKDSWGDVK